jgi:deoxyribodipyrimidine photo-lyase
MESTGKTRALTEDPRAAYPSKRFQSPLPALDYWGLTSEAKIIEPGEKAARKRLAKFLNGPASVYRDKRNALGEAGTSRLSQDLRFGTLSPRQVFFGCAEAGREASAPARQSINSFVNELIWREFYMQILAHFPTVLARKNHTKVEATSSLRASNLLNRRCASI